MLHCFYNPLDWDSCLAAWATQHALGDAVVLNSDESLSFSDMLMLNRAPTLPLPDAETPANILYITTKAKEIRCTHVNANLSVISKHQPCCLSAWQNFHASPPPSFIALMDKSYGKCLDDVPAFNALLGTPWDIGPLDKFITGYEDPQRRANLLADGHAIMQFRKLRGDLSANA